MIQILTAREVLNVDKTIANQKQAFTKQMIAVMSNNIYVVASHLTHTFVILDPVLGVIRVVQDHTHVEWVKEIVILTGIAKELSNVDMAIVHQEQVLTALMIVAIIESKHMYYIVY